MLPESDPQSRKLPKFPVDLRGRSALATGAGSGPGRTIALALAASGASVAVSDINIERAEQVVERIKRQGGTAIALHADVSNRFQAANLIERVRDEFGGIDILVNGAEIFHAEPLLAIDEWNWRRQLEVNISGAFFCLQLAARVMADEGGGAIINLLPAEALHATLPAGIGYLAGKASLAAMTRQAARELAQYGIRVNGIAFPQGDSPTSSSAQAAIPAGIGGAALFLCSEAARSINGQVLVVGEPV